MFLHSYHIYSVILIAYVMYLACEDLRRMVHGAHRSAKQGAESIENRSVQFVSEAQFDSRDYQFLTALQYPCPSREYGL